MEASNFSSDYFSLKNLRHNYYVMWMGPKSDQIQDSKQMKNTAGNYFNSLVPTCSCSGRASLDTLWIGIVGWFWIEIGWQFSSDSHMCFLPATYCCHFHLVVLVCTCVGRWSQFLKSVRHQKWLSESWHMSDLIRYGHNTRESHYAYIISGCRCTVYKFLNQTGVLQCTCRLPTGLSVPISAYHLP